jgi:hypothetical protein
MDGSSKETVEPIGSTKTFNYSFESTESTKSTYGSMGFDSSS